MLDPQTVLDALVLARREEDALAELEREKQARRATEEEWSPAWREHDEAELRARVASRLARATLPPSLTEARAAAFATAGHEAVRACDLRDEGGASVCLGFTLFLRGAPSPNETRAIAAALRRRFPEPTNAWVERISSRSSAVETSLAEGDLALVSATELPGSGGEYGVTIVLKEEPPAHLLLRDGGAPVADPTLTIHAAGPVADGQKAAYVDLRLPVETDPARLLAFVTDVAEIVPFVSGHAGYRATASGEPAVAKVYEWSRRFLALDVQDLRLELGGLRDAVKGASWLTLLGAPLASALRERFGSYAFDFGAANVETIERRHGLVFRAGELTLGDVRRGELPLAIAEVARRIAPLRMTSMASEDLRSIGGDTFAVSYASYDGPFSDGGATHAWLARWVEPEAHLGPTPIDRGEALLSAIAIAAARQEDAMEHWTKEKQRGSPRFSELVRLLVAAASGHEATDEGVAALDFACRSPTPMQGVALVKLLYGLLMRGDLDRAATYLELARELGPKLPILFHNSACVVARRGERANAIALVKAAKAHRYAQWREMKDDDDLASLRGDPDFEALFSE